MTEKNDQDDLRPYRFLGVSLIQWLLIMIVASTGLLLILRHWFG